MNTVDLIDELVKKPNEEIKYALLALMLKGKIDFLDLNASYISYLKEVNGDKEKQLDESDTCLMQMMFLGDRKKKFSEIENEILQRGLYRLNQSNRFNTSFLNKKFNYIGDEEAKKLTSNG